MFDYDYLDSYSGYSAYDSYYSNPYSYSSKSSSSGSFLGFLFGMGLLSWLITIALVALTFVGMWKTFKKAGKPGYEALIAGHSQFVMFELSGIKPYFIFLMFVPIANIVVPFWLNIQFAKSFGKGTGFGVGLTLLPVVFFPILGLGSAQYIGPAYSGDFSNNSGMNNSSSNFNSNPSSGFNSEPANPPSGFSNDSFSQPSSFDNGPVTPPPSGFNDGSNNPPNSL